jgi:hypothetical protein
MCELLGISPQALFGQLLIGLINGSGQNSPSMSCGLVRACASQGFRPKIP